ncbi:hypothetical protein PO909_006672 [Leuciscus waleckii]
MGDQCSLDRERGNIDACNVRWKTKARWTEKEETGACNVRWETNAHWTEKEASSRGFNGSRGDITAAAVENIARVTELLQEQRRHPCCGSGEYSQSKRAPEGAEETSLLQQWRKLDRETELLRE